MIRTSEGKIMATCFSSTLFHTFLPINPHKGMGAELCDWEMGTLIRDLAEILVRTFKN